KHEARLMKSIAALQATEAESLRYASTYNCVASPTSITLLTLQGLGSESRQRFASQLAGAAPGALKAAAEYCRQIGDPTLAAAVFVENGKYPREQRLFSNDDFADRFFADKAHEIHKSYVTARSAVQSALLYLRELKSGKTTQTTNGKISIGLAKMQ